MKCLPEEYRYYLGDGNENNKGGQNINNTCDKSKNDSGKGVLDLFNAPNKFAKPGKEFSSSHKGKK